MPRSVLSRQVLLLIVTTAGVFQFIASAIRPDSINLHNFLAALGSGSPPPRLQGWRKVDAALNRAFPEKFPTVMADFRGTRSDDDPDGQLRALVITRATYRFWPARFYFGDPSVPRVWEREVAAAHLPSDPAWPAAHGVKANAHITLGPALQPLQIDIEPMDRP